nr:MAG: putative RNA-dependent RNA polymerase [Picobirnavirus sp.]
MPKDSVTSFIKSHAVNYNYTASWTDDGVKALRTYLGNVSRGQPKVYTAPFAKGQSMEKVLNDWMGTLVSLETRWPTLVSYEEDQAKKVGPMSVQLPLEERMDDIRHYYDDILLSSTPIDDGAISYASLEFQPIAGLRLRGQAATLDNMKVSTNSGNPWFTKKRDVTQEALNSEVQLSEWKYGPSVSGCLLNMPIHDWWMTAVIGWRGQEGGPSEEDTKQRVVWMFPFSVNLCELQLYQPLIEAAQKRNLVPAWVSMESVDAEVTQLFDTKRPEDLIVCTDFSRFDQHFNKHLQGAAKTILTRLMTWNAQSHDWLERVFPIKYAIPLTWKCSRYGEDYHCTEFRGYHGMASGSGGTNVDETLAHRAMQWEAALKQGEMLNPHSMCLGDDGILTYPYITVDEVVAAYSAHGQECNRDKQYASAEDCVYLRRWHHNEYRVGGVCVGVYPTTRALGRLRYLERFMDPEYWSAELVALRQLSIIENCKWHPLFHEFIEFCMERDRYRLGIDIPGFMDNISKLANEATGYMQDFLGYTKTMQGASPEGIADWEVVKYLKSKS